jgi:hypothetical protein
MDSHEVCCGQGPAEVGMVDVGNTFLFPDSGDVVLKYLYNRVSTLRRNDSLEVQAVEVEWTISKSVTDFLALDHDELIFRAMESVETFDRGDIVVVGQDQEMVAVLPVPSDNFVRCTVPVTIQCMGVRVPFVPIQGRASRLRQSKLTGKIEQPPT